MTDKEKTEQEWQEFESDDAFLQHILSKKPAEELVAVPEWGAKVLCKALNAEHLLEVEEKAFDPEKKTMVWQRAFYLLVMYGCYNPRTGNLLFTKEHEHAIMREQGGGPVELLALTVLSLSRVASSERTKKN